MRSDIRLLVVGPSLPQHLASEALEASGIHVVAQVPGPAALPLDEAIDAVLVTDDRLLDDLGDQWLERAAPALVVLARDERTTLALPSQGLRGWAIVGRDTAADAVAAAIVAAASGFAVRPAASDADDEESGPVEALTPREREVLELVSEGLPNKAIASRLGLSDHTVKFHLASVFSKLGVSTRTEAVRKAVRAGMIDF